MTLSKLLGYTLLFCSLGLPALAQPTEDPLRQALQLAGNKEYAKAEELLLQLEKAAPQAPDVKAAQATVCLWKADFICAKKIIDPLIETYPDNPDYRLLRANWYYYQGILDPAEQDFAAIVARFPTYEEAQTGLTAVRAQKREKETGQWRLDTGFGLSAFQHSDQSNWHHEFFQMARAFDDKALWLHLRGERFSQYNQIDALYEGGLSRKFSEALYVDLTLDGAPQAIYKPVFRLQSSVNGRLTTEAQTYFPVWGSLAFQDAWYKTVENRTFTAGPTLALAEDWDASAKMIYTYQIDGKSTWGWIGQLNGRFAPGFRFTAGYAFAPDLEESSITAVDTAFAGLIYDISDVLSVRLDYAREDRAQSYTRNSVDVSFSYRF